MAHTLTFSIGGTDRTAMIRLRDTILQTGLTIEGDAGQLVFIDPDGALTPTVGQEVLVNDGTSDIWGGYINRTMQTKLNDGRFAYTLELVGYIAELDRRLVVESWTSQTLSQIVSDVITNYTSGFTTTGVETGPTIASFRANYIKPSLVFEKLHRRTGYEWYIAPDKDIKFYLPGTKPAPSSFALTDGAADGDWQDLVITRGPLTQIVTEAVVRGATKLSDREELFRSLGDGEKRLFVFGSLAQSVEVWVNGVQKNVGFRDVDTGQDWYHDYAAMAVVQDSGGTTLTASDTIVIYGKREVGIRFPYTDYTLRDTDGWGVRQALVNDPTIKSDSEAVAAGKLAIQGLPIRGEFKSFVTGWRAGQTFSINLANRGLTGKTGVVSATTMRYAGQLDQWLTTVQFEVVD